MSEEKIKTGYEHILVTGGAGFIGSNLIRVLFEENLVPDLDFVANLDVLTYAGNRRNLSDLEGNNKYRLIRDDICDTDRLESIFRFGHFDAVLHLAAESHVDRSLQGPQAFFRTNVMGTTALLDAARRHGVKRFVLVSTDEVYGSLPDDGQSKFRETTPLDPTSPYAASKAAADLAALSYHKSFGMDVVVTRCSNNFGPYQFPEKMIPLMVINALCDRPLPVYGDGRNVRDWIHARDHARGIVAALLRGQPGRVYNIGANQERRNLEIVDRILDQLGKPKSLIRFVTDRPAHDLRYATDATRAREELGWEPRIGFDEGLRQTVQWYVDNRAWWEEIIHGPYRSYYDKLYGERLAG